MSLDATFPAASSASAPRRRGQYPRQPFPLVSARRACGPQCPGANIIQGTWLTLSCFGYRAPVLKRNPLILNRMPLFFGSPWANFVILSRAQGSPHSNALPSPREMLRVAHTSRPAGCMRSRVLASGTSGSDVCANRARDSGQIAGNRLTNGSKNARLVLWSLPDSAKKEVGPGGYRVPRGMPRPTPRGCGPKRFAPKFP